MSEELGTDIRLRRLVKELLEPTIRRAMEDREQLGRLSKDVESLQRKVTDYEFAFSKVHKKLALAEDMGKRQTDLEAAQRSLDSKTTAHAQTIKTDLDSLTAALDQKTSALGSLDKHVSQLAAQLRDCSDSLLTFRATTQQDLQTQETSTLHTLEDFKTQLSQTRELLEGLDAQQQRVNVLLGDSGAELAALNKHLASLRSRTERLETEKAALASVGELQAELQAVRGRSLADKEAMERRLRVALEAQGPYSQLICLADLLHEVLEPRTLSRLLQLEKTKYSAWLDLTTLSPSLEPDIRAALQRAEAMSLRLNSETIQRSRTQLERKASDLSDFPEHKADKSPMPAKVSWEQPVSQHFHSQALAQEPEAARTPTLPKEQVSSPMPYERVSRPVTPVLPNLEAKGLEKTSVSSFKPPSEMPPPAVSTFKNHSISKATANVKPEKSPVVSSLKEKTPAPSVHEEAPIKQDLNEASSVYSAQAQEFVAFYTDSESEAEERQTLTTELAVLRDEMRTRIGEAERLMREAAESCSSLVRQVGSECNALSHQRKRDKADLAAQLGTLQEELQRIKTDQVASSAAVERFAQLYARLVESCRIGIVLSVQDEEDRQSIALIGAGAKPKSAVLSVERPSAMFSGTNVQNAFKMACLAYAPSPVTYRQTVFQRRDLLEVQRRLLETAWEEASRNEPWASLEVPVRRSVVLRRASPNSWSGVGSIISEEPEEPKRAATSLGVRPPRARSLSSRQK